MGPIKRGSLDGLKDLKGGCCDVLAQIRHGQILGFSLFSSQATLWLFLNYRNIVSFKSNNSALRENANSSFPFSV